MFYPDFLHPGDTIGICAPSAGVGHKLESFDASLSVLHLEGYHTLETASVRNNDIRSAAPEIRGAEFNFLAGNTSIQMIMPASGGNFNLEMLPYIDWSLLQEHPFLVSGASDPTNILFPLTTKYDIATIYGFNAGTFDWRPLHPFQKNALSILRGEIPVQTSFDRYDSGRDYSADGPNLDAEVYWISRLGTEERKLDVSGRLIGGCLDCISRLLGTPYDGTAAFLERYADDGIIWFFDPYQMSAENLYLTMLQMKYSGYFEHTRAILFGRVMFTEGSDDADYLNLLARCFPNIPIIWNCDIGHVKPAMTLINGAIAAVHCENGRGTIEMTMK